MTPQERTAMLQALDALETAQNGLEWYSTTHPEDHAECDDDVVIEIEAACAALQTALTDPSEVQQGIEWKHSSVPEWATHSTTEQVERLKYQIDETHESVLQYTSDKLKYHQMTCNLSEDELERLRLAASAAALNGLFQAGLLTSIKQALTTSLHTLQEVDEAAVYWSEYDVPILLHTHVQSAIQILVEQLSNPIFQNESHAE